MYLLDANAILRYILNDIPKQKEKVDAIIKEGSATIGEVVAEVVYVLSKTYKIPREDTSAIVMQALEKISIKDKDTIFYALKTYAKSRLDYVDCLLIARGKLKKENIITFDKKLKARLFMEEERKYK